MPRIVEIAAGLFVVLVVLADVFRSVIVPRAVGRLFRLSGFLSPAMWRLWKRYAARIGDTERREDALATFAPLSLVVLLVVWVAGLVFGYGLLFFGLRNGVRPHPTIAGAMYFAGTSLLTIGYGDVVPTSGLTRFLAIVAGASGFGTVAVVTTYLFSLFGAFERREVFVTNLGVRAGAPPSGVTLLETHARLRMRAALGDTFVEGQRWAAELLHTHLAYPILTYFRSSHDYESWIGALGALLDGSTLVLTTVRDDAYGQARLVNDIGRHLVHDLVRYFNLDSGNEDGFERPAFDDARERLRAAGYDVVDADDAWDAFVKVRAFYAGSLNAMARYWSIPPAQWIGDQSRLPARHGNEEVPDALRDGLETSLEQVSRDGH